MNTRVPHSLVPRNKDINGNRPNAWGSCYFYLSDRNYSNDNNRLMFMNLLKCYTNRNKAVSFKSLVNRNPWNNYWSPYIPAGECRSISKYFKDALKRETIYMVNREFKIKESDYHSLTIKNTMVITKRPYTEETLFLKALCDDGIRGINNKEKHFFFRLLKYMEKSQGVWL